MTWAQPAALWALLVVPLLIWLARRRQRPLTRTWPSLLLWRDVSASESGAPQRRLDRLLVLEIVAVVLLALAAAQPALPLGAAPRRVVIAWDRGRHMQAVLPDGRTAHDATAAEVARLRAALARDDVVVEVDLPRDGLARGNEDWLVVATFKDGFGGHGISVVGRAPDARNRGIDALAVENGTVWYTTRDENGVMKEHRVPWRDEIVLPGDDAYPADNRIVLTKFTLRVAVEPPVAAHVRAAVEAAGISAQLSEDAQLSIVRGAATRERWARVRGADCVASGIAAGLWWGDAVWQDVFTLPPDTPRPLLSAGGRVIAAWKDESTLWLGMSLDKDWDDHGTLALLIERAKRERVRALVTAPHSYVGGAVAAPAPGWVDLTGRDQPWDGFVPAAPRRTGGRVALRTGLALLAAIVVALYVVWMRAAPRPTRPAPLVSDLRP